MKVKESYLNVPLKTFIYLGTIIYPIFNTYLPEYFGNCLLFEFSTAEFSTFKTLHVGTYLKKNESYNILRVAAITLVPR